MGSVSARISNWIQPVDPQLYWQVSSMQQLIVDSESLKVTLAGLALGILCTFSVTGFFPTEGIGWSGSGIFLYHVSRTDGLTYSLVAGLLTIVVLAASWMPASLAMRIDPIVALRHE